MNITVYCGAATGNNSAYSEAVQLVGKWMASNNHQLIYGGGKAGLMGILADEVLKNNGEVIGVMPTFLIDRELSHPNLTQLEIVNTMSERKNRMVELSDCFIALPGGPGTLEEISEVISWARIGQHKNPCILWNINGYYNKLKEFFDDMVESGFLSESDKSIMLFTDSIEELEQFIEHFKPVAVRTY